MAHNHGSHYQVKVIHYDGTEALSDWTDRGSIAHTLASLRKPQAKAYWLRERSITVADCTLCQDGEVTIVEYPLTDCLSLRNGPHDSAYLVSSGLKDASGLPAIRSKSAGR
jgi:hypothetical protein